MVNLWAISKKLYGRFMVFECIVVLAKSHFRLNISSQLVSNEP